MENPESNGHPENASSITTEKTETAGADNGVSVTIPASEPLPVLHSEGEKVSGEKEKVNNVPDKKSDVSSGGEENLLAVTGKKEKGEEEKIDDTSNENGNENRPTTNIATSGDANDAVTVSTGEKAEEEEKLGSTVKGIAAKALVQERKINNTPKKANRRKKMKKKTTLRDTADAVASTSRGKETVSGAEKKVDEDEVKGKVGYPLNKANKRRKLKKRTGGASGSAVSVVSGGEKNEILEMGVVDTPKKPNKLKRKKAVSAHSADANAAISGGEKKMEAEDEGNIENMPNKAKTRGRRGGKGRKKNTTLTDSNAVAKNADKPEISTAGKASERAESMGMIFMCNAKTKRDCYRYKVLGLPASKKETVAKICKGMRLFLFDIDLKLLYGIYKAAGPGGYNIEHEAFNSAFPSQVRFTILDDCFPLPLEKFKEAIKDNFYAKNKFNCELTAEQVKNLCKLFRPTTKISEPKQDAKVDRREVPSSVDRDRKRRRDPAKVDRGEVPSFVDRDGKRKRDPAKVDRGEVPSFVDRDRKRKRDPAKVDRREVPSSVDRDRKRRRDSDRVKSSKSGGDRFRTSRIDMYQRPSYSSQPLPPTLPRAPYEREAYPSTSLPSFSSPPLNAYGQPIQTGIYRRDLQRERHHYHLAYSRIGQQGEIGYQDSNILYQEPSDYRDPYNPAGISQGYYRPPY